MFQKLFLKILTKEIFEALVENAPVIMCMKFLKTFVSYSYF